MTRHLFTWLAVAVLAPGTAVPAAGGETDGGKAPAARPGGPDKPPGGEKPADPPVDYVAELIEKYHQGTERDRFFRAAGVDGEIDREEWADDAKRTDGFVRGCDDWSAALTHDQDGNGRLNWAEAEGYRLSMRKRLLVQFDGDSDGKLAGPERQAANEFLRRGGIRRPAQDSRKQWDTDGDGKLNDKQREAAAARQRPPADEARAR